MKIALFSSPVHTVPPHEKNILAPWELVAELANGLTDRGHEVLLFAPKGSMTRAKLYDGDVTPIMLEKNAFPDQNAYRSHIFEKSLEFFQYMKRIVAENNIDIVHVHQSIEVFTPALSGFPSLVPIVCTFHDVVDASRFDALSNVLTNKNVHFIGISQSQFLQTTLPVDAVVYNGIDIEKFGFSDQKELSDRPLLAAGRIVPEKGFTDAIHASQKSGVRLMIVGQRYEENPIARDYFDREVKPNIDGKQVIWEPVVKRDHLVGHYQTARALLFPIHWEEPFGLVMIEAMACGTPVIAYNRGSVSEIVRDGVTGYIVEEEEETDRTNRSYTSNKTNFIIKKKGVAGLAEAIMRIGEIDRAACRKHVEDHFTVEKMVEGYENVYKKVLADQ